MQQSLFRSLAMTFGSIYAGLFCVVSIQRFCRIYEDAKDFFTSAIDHNNKVGQFYVHRARALYMMEEVEEARRDILVALHLDPDNDEVGLSK